VFGEQPFYKNGPAVMVGGGEFANVEQSGSARGSSSLFTIWRYRRHPRDDPLSFEARIYMTCTSADYKTGASIRRHFIALFQTVGVLVAEISDRFGSVSWFMTRDEDPRAELSQISNSPASTALF